ncbi:MAG: ethanolamine utilization protein [Firmicutes bacterium HGW-Firmicutes-4]|jgi:ethanolamine utilization protein EutQ|nr:MAG: ethanolamine utilization protein [Firmicutes bacterium HGW-Firmicutes-4]
MEKNIEKMVKNNVLESNISEELIARIVNEVMESLNTEESLLQKKSEPDRIRLIEGESVVFENFDTGNAKDKVTFKEVLTIEECPNMATGFLRIEESSFDWYLGYDELDYVIEGTLDITYNGKTYTGHAGDVIFIPKETAVTFSSPNYCKFFFAAYPANWQDLCEEKK